MGKILSVLLFLFIIPGCSMLSPVKGPEHTYVLSCPGHIEVTKRSPITLFVPPIESFPIFNTTQMAYSLKPFQISYFSKNAWTEPPGIMLHPLLIQTLQQSHFFHAVTSHPALFDYSLRVQLLELKQNFLYAPSIIQLKLRAQLIEGASNRIIATKQICISKPTACRNPYSGVIAANEAATEALTELASFVIHTLK